MLNEDYKELRKEIMGMLLTNKKPRYNSYVQGFGIHVMRLIGMMEQEIEELKGENVDD